MVSFRDNNLATRFLSKDEMKSLAPRAFRTTPSNPNVTDRYVVASTEQVIDDLATMGWYPVEIKQQKERKANSVRSFHIVVFQNPDVAITKGYIYTDKNGNTYTKDELARTFVKFGRLYGSDRNGKTFEIRESKVIDAFPRIILTNSYDGFNAFTFRVGLYRLVCSNGLVVCTDSFVNISVRHTKYNIEVLSEIVAKAIKSVDEQIGTFNDMREVELTDEQKNEFAINAVRIRQNLADDAKVEVDEDGIADLLTPIRPEDEGNSLWNVFNVLQEKVTKGGAIVGINGKKARKMRGIKSFSKDLAMNEKLYKTALSYLPLAA